MTRKHAAQRLLQHGPLAMADFVAITGWPKDQAVRTLQSLLAQGSITSTQPGSRRTTYRLEA